MASPVFMHSRPNFLPRRSQLPEPHTPRKQETMPISASRVPTFSEGLQFTTEDVHEFRAHSAVDHRWSITDEGPYAAGTPSVREEMHCFNSEEERLLWKAAKLRHSIETDLMPRQELVECALRQGRRELVKMQHLLPSVDFLAFRQKCAAWCYQLRLFEELVVDTMLREAVECAARSGEVTTPAQWRKSNQWPSITNFLELQLRLWLTLGDNGVVESTSEQLTRETSAVYRHLSVIWADQQRRCLTSDFLDRYYSLRDIVHGWGIAWRMRGSCDDEEQSVSSAVHSRLPDEANNSCICPFPAWESLSEVDRLNSYSKICASHLSKDVAECLETLLVTNFGDVLSHVQSVTTGASA
ncbi:hypothetical protein, conserved [Leishmania tarentolae]|uniref:Uncharacterized protein n=1 Tax=Leishmania tarentolae TaxID=5689 RepID=A0A640KWM5_LEITA|nr:hypothetical protein, conserved [Leishmania tarentolae]